MVGKSSVKAGTSTRIGGRAMAILNEQRVIAIEEHYYDDNITQHFTGIDARTGGPGHSV